MRQIQRIVAYSPSGGKLPAIPTPTEYSWSTPLNDVSGATVSYRDGTVGAEVLSGLCEIAAEYSLDNGNTWTEFPNGRYLRLGRSGNEVDPDGVRSYTLPGYGWLLNKMRQMKTPSPGTAGSVPFNADGKRMFNSSNAGMIMKTLIDEAHDRGVCPALTYDFTSSLDSNGQAWNKVLSIGYEPGLDLFTILNNLSQQGIVDWYFQGRTLRIFNADGFLARDTPVKFTFPQDFKGLPYQGSYEDFVHEVMILGDNGKRLNRSNVGVPTPWGKWEGFISQGGVSDTATMTILAQSALDDGNHEKLQYTAEVNCETSNFEPIQDYRQGDYVEIPVGNGTVEKFRIRQLNYSRGSDGDLSLSLVINDRFLEKEIRTARRVNGISGGASAGGSGTPPTKDPGARPPKKPVGLVIDSTAVINNFTGRAEAWVRMEYPEVNLDRDDVALEVKSYTFQARRPVVNFLAENPSFESAYTGGSNAATVTTTTEWKSDGLQSLKITPDGANNASMAYPVGFPDALGSAMALMGVLPGRTYVLSADIRVLTPQTGSLNTGARRIRIGTRSTAGVVNENFAQSPQAPNSVGTARLSVKFTVPPSGITDLFFSLYNGSQVTTQSICWDNVSILADVSSPWEPWSSWGTSTALSHGYGPVQPGTTWQAQMAAVSETGIRGEWSDIVQFTAAADVEPPPTPSAPILSTRLGTLTVSWDRKDDAGNLMPRDTDYVVIHRLGSPDPIGRILFTGGSPLITSDVVIGDEYELWFTAVDTAGNESGPSTHNTVTIASIMDDPEAALDIQNGVTVASGGNYNTYSPDPPTPADPGQKVGDRWFRLDAGRTIGIWHWDGMGWVPQDIDGAVLANIDAGSITTGTLLAARLAAGSITGDKIQAGAITGVKLSADAIDGKIITGASIYGGTFATVGRTAYSDFNTGIFIQSNGTISVRGPNTPAVAGGHILLVSPAGIGYVRVGTAGTGNGGWMQIDGNGRMRVYLNSNNAVFLDINPGAGSQNMRVGGALFADTLNLGNAMAGTIYGIMTADSAGVTIQPNGTNRAVNLLSSGSAHVTLNGAGTGQVRSMTIVGDFITHSSAGAMVARTDNGQIGMAGSSERFKVAISDHEFSGDILSLSPRTWYDRRESERYVELLDGIAAGIDPTEEELEAASHPLDPGYGLIAEEVEAAGLGEFVLKNSDGEIVSLAYERMWVALIPVIKDLKNRIEELENGN